MEDILKKFVDDLKIKTYSKSDGKTSNTIALISEINIKSYQIHTVNSSERIDIISKQYYGTPDYYWLIALVNNIDDFIVDFKKGKTLIIPDLTV